MSDPLTNQNQEKLTLTRKIKINSWLFWTLIPYLNFLAWVQAAVATREFRYWLLGGLYSVPLLGLAFASPNKQASDMWSTFGVLSWIGGIVHALIVRKAVSQKSLAGLELTQHTPERGHSAATPTPFWKPSDKPTIFPQAQNFIKAFLGILFTVALMVKCAQMPGKALKGAKEAAVGGSSPQKAQVALPAEQQQFNTAVTPFIVQYQGAPNELKKSALRSERKSALANTLKTLEFNEWIGTIRKMETTSEGNAHLVIRFEGTPVRIQNWNNELSDIGSKTLIPKNSELFKAVAELAVGNRVKVSGTFLSGNKDHIEEHSLTEAGSMTEPEFTVKFSKVTKF